MNVNKCFVCGTVLTEENSSDEHILLNALGGHIHSKKLLCKRCNSVLGTTSDEECRTGHTRRRPTRLHPSRSRCPCAPGTVPQAHRGRRHPGSGGASVHRAHGERCLLPHRPWADPQTVLTVAQKAGKPASDGRWKRREWRERGGHDVEYPYSCFESTQNNGQYKLWPNCFHVRLVCSRHDRQIEKSLEDALVNCGFIFQIFRFRKRGQGSPYQVVYEFPYEKKQEDNHRIKRFSMQKMLRDSRGDFVEKMKEVKYGTAA